MAPIKDVEESIIEGNVTINCSSSEKSATAYEEANDKISSTINPQIVKQNEPENQDITGDSDPNIVDWDGDDDTQNPYNWPTWLKVLNCGMISMLTFVTPLASCKKKPWQLKYRIMLTAWIYQPCLHQESPI